MCLAVATQQCAPELSPHPLLGGFSALLFLHLKSQCHTFLQVGANLTHSSSWSQLLFDPRRCGGNEIESCCVLGASRRCVCVSSGTEDGVGAFPDITSPCMRGRWSLLCSAVPPGTDPIKHNTGLWSIRHVLPSTLPYTHLLVRE